MFTAPDSTGSQIFFAVWGFLSGFLPPWVAGAPGIGERIIRPGLLEGPQAKGATIAHAARHLLRLVTRPRELERRAQFEAAMNNFVLPQMNNRGHDF